MRSESFVPHPLWNKMLTSLSLSQIRSKDEVFRLLSTFTLYLSQNEIGYEDVRQVTPNTVDVRNRWVYGEEEIFFYSCKIKTIGENGITHPHTKTTSRGRTVGR